MQIPFYCDYACPWAYLASCRAESYFEDLSTLHVFGDGARGIFAGACRRRTTEAAYAVRSAFE